MSDLHIDVDGLKELEELLAQYADKTENIMDILEAGAQEFVNDVRKLPKPRSSIRKAGYTHLLDSVTYRKKNGEVEAGWGKYYGPMKEKGTKKMSATPHFAPTFERNKEKYYNAMLRNGGLQ